MKYHLTPVRMAIINKTGNSKCWRGGEEQGILIDCWWKCRLVQVLWKTMATTQKIKNRVIMQSILHVNENSVYENQVGSSRMDELTHKNY